jgi:uncharacterized protein
MSSIYHFTVPVLLRGFKTLSGYLDKTEENAKAREINPTVFVNARLAPDMLPLSGQIQRASDTAKGAVARLTGMEVPSFPDTETTMDELRARIAKTVDLLESVPAERFDGAAERTVSLRFTNLNIDVTGEDYVAQFVIPNFFFHVVTAHAILRHNGVPLGKADFIRFR